MRGLLLSALVGASAVSGTSVLPVSDLLGRADTPGEALARAVVHRNLGMSGGIYRITTSDMNSLAPGRMSPEIYATGADYIYDSLSGVTDAVRGKDIGAISFGVHGGHGNALATSEDLGKTHWWTLSAPERIGRDLKRANPEIRDIFIEACNANNMPLYGDVNIQSSIEWAKKLAHPKPGYGMTFHQPKYDVSLVFDNKMEPVFGPRIPVDDTGALPRISTISRGGEIASSPVMEHRTGIDAIFMSGHFRSNEPGKAAPTGYSSRKPIKATTEERSAAAALIAKIEGQETAGTVKAAETSGAGIIFGIPAAWPRKPRNAGAGDGIETPIGNRRRKKSDGEVPESLLGNEKAEEIAQVNVEQESHENLVRRLQIEKDTTPTQRISIDSGQQAYADIESNQKHIEKVRKRLDNRTKWREAKAAHQAEVAARPVVPKAEITQAQVEIPAITSKPERRARRVVPEERKARSRYKGWYDQLELNNKLRFNIVTAEDSELADALIRLPKHSPYRRLIELEVTRRAQYRPIASTVTGEPTPKATAARNILDTPEYSFIPQEPGVTYRERRGTSPGTATKNKLDELWNTRKDYTSREEAVLDRDDVDKLKNAGIGVRASTHPQGGKSIHPTIDLKDGSILVQEKDLKWCRYYNKSNRGWASDPITVVGDPVEFVSTFDPTQLPTALRHRSSVDTTGGNISDASKVEPTASIPVAPATPEANLEQTAKILPTALPKPVEATGPKPQVIKQVINAEAKAAEPPPPKLPSGTFRTTFDGGEYRAVLTSEHVATIGLGVGALLFANLMTVGKHGPGRKRDDPDSPAGGAQKAAMSAAITSSIVGAMERGSKYAQGLRAATFFGADFMFGFSADRKRGQSLGYSVGANAAGAAAGLIAFGFGKEVAKPAYSSFSKMMSAHGLGGKLEGMERAYTNAVNKFPALKNFATPTSAGLFLAMGTIPVAHAAIHRLIAAHHRSQHLFGNIVNQTSLVQSQAGETEGRQLPTGEYYAGSGSPIAKIDFDTIYRNSGRYIGHIF